MAQYYVMKRSANAGCFYFLALVLIGQVFMDLY